MSYELVAWKTYMATIGGLMPSIWRPIETQPQWAAWMIVLMTIWSMHFLQRKKPDAIVQEEERKKRHVLAMMKAILAYSAEEEAKPESERKLPEAKRVLDLLWDEVHGCRTLAWGIAPTDERNVQTEALYRRVASAELAKAVELTRRARVAGAIQAAGKEEMKELTEHESGEKLHAALVRDKTVRKNLGKSFAVGKASRREAEILLREVYRDQKRNVTTLLRLLRPVVPHVAFAISIGMLRTALCARFHQIGLWVQVIETGVGGNTEAALSLLVNLWLGHMIIKLLELPENTYFKRSKAGFGNIIRNGVLSSMVSKDYEYFDRNDAGVLQDRLNKDCDELGEYSIHFPKEIVERTVWIATNMYQVYTTAPPKFFAAACVPVISMCAFQFLTFKYFRQCNERARRVEEEGVSATSEVLRHIKTVRQFASEQRAASTYARRNLARQLIGERIYTLKRILEVMVWMIFDSGICLTIVLGLPYVQRGELTAGELIDCFCKLNFNVNFCLREMLETLPRMSRILEPMGRICDLLQATPTIEPPAHPAHVDAPDARALAALLASCKPHFDGKGFARLTLARTDEAAALAAGTEAPASALPLLGSQLCFLSSADHRFVTPAELMPNAEEGELSSIATAPPGLTYPVRAVFSSKLRPPRFHGAIEFRDVHFAYPTDLRKPVLQGLSFKIEPGQKVALVGPTGCGKSSTMSLLQRLYDPERGQILIDGVPLQNYDLPHLRSRVVIVDQYTTLFSTTIFDNITYGLEREVGEAEVIEACKRAKAWDGFIDERPDKLMSRISGENLSGGQKQRLAIARAIIRKPDIILLDEATSALDNANEALVQKALDELARQGSALVIAHRLSTIRDADQIVVVHNGRAVEIGTHDELITKLTTTSSSTDTAALPPPALKPPSPLRRKSSQSFDELTKQEAQAEEEAVEAVVTEAGSSLESSPLLKPTLRRSNSCPRKLAYHCPDGGNVTYRSLWEAATGGAEAKTLKSVGEKIAKAEKELQELKAAKASMEGARRSLLLELGAEALPAVGVTPVAMMTLGDVTSSKANVSVLDEIKGGSGNKGEVALLVPTRGNSL